MILKLQSQLNSISIGNKSGPYDKPLQQLTLFWTYSVDLRSFHHRCKMASQMLLDSTGAWSLFSRVLCCSLGFTLALALAHMLCAKIKLPQSWKWLQYAFIDIRSLLVWLPRSWVVQAHALAAIMPLSPFRPEDYNFSTKRLADSRILVGEG